MPSLWLSEWVLTPKAGTKETRVTCIPLTAHHQAHGICGLNLTPNTPKMWGPSGLQAWVQNPCQRPLCVSVLEHANGT